MNCCYSVQSVTASRNEYTSLGRPLFSLDQRILPDTKEPVKLSSAQPQKTSGSASGGKHSRKRSQSRPTRNPLLFLSNMFGRAENAVQTIPNEQPEYDVSLSYLLTRICFPLESPTSTAEGLRILI